MAHWELFCFAELSTAVFFGVVWESLVIGFELDLEGRLV